MHPITNETINKIPDLYISYFERLRNQGIVSEEDLKSWHQDNLAELNKAYKISTEGDFSFSENAYLEREK